MDKELSKIGVEESSQAKTAKTEQDRKLDLWLMQSFPASDPLPLTPLLPEENKDQVPPLTSKPSEV